MTTLPVFVLLLLICFCKSDDRLTPAKPLSPGDKLISNGGIFALGFFSPTNSTAYSYVGIWYHHIPERTYVWVANRDNPITSSSHGKLVLTNGSNLVLSDSKGHTLWTTTNNIAADGLKTAAILLDSGNLVIMLPNGTDIWQSFHHPTDTMLPNMSLPLRNYTNFGNHLVAWRGPDDPSTSNYSLGGDSSLQIFAWNGTRQYWRRAALDGVFVYAVYQGNSGPIMYQNIESRGDDFYLTYTVSKGSPSMRVLLHYTGMVKLLTWNGNSSSWDVFSEHPTPNCDRYASCGPFGYCDNTQAVPTCKCLDGFESDGLDFSVGCWRKKELHCSSEEDSFMTLPNTKTPDNFLYIRNRSFDQCTAECSHNCSCTAYAYANLTGIGRTIDQSRCLVWMGELIDTAKRRDGLGENLYLRIPSSSASKKKTGALKIVLPVIASLLILVCVYLIWMRKLRGKRQNKGHMDFGMQGQLSNSDEAYNQNSEFLWISFPDIVAATNGFSDSNVLGKGGFGRVYKGILKGGGEVAVKRLTKCSDQGIEHFVNEVVLIGKLQHRNLVRLLGYCIHGDEKLLMYEYLPNKTNDAIKSMLDWPTRFRIIKGIARGLLYLHQDSRMTIIHRDLKASNILLDADMRPKISDFGMARIFGDNQQQANTRHVVGTYYMSPEYAMEGVFSVKSDAYSYGVLLLEIVSGLKISSPHHLIMDFRNLIDYAWNLLMDGNPSDFLDAVLLKSCSLHEVSLCIHVGLLCVQDSPSARPLMSLVVSMLDNEVMPLPTPKQPLYFVGRKHEAEEARDNSANTASLTTLAGR